ncbi:predicted protein [Nematostella vectensis]|uniref:PHD-type domain-containing protein n=1 Tax=Nematostella vectensis TaxID=45351 RepID=A7SI42_NEMVE|nr:predicted protein [Nematostella vectensis]|eukprot:XP_001628678.1 predicted protein [Nematostella vectensis]
MAGSFWCSFGCFLWLYVFFLFFFIVCSLFSNLDLNRSSSGSHHITEYCPWLLSNHVSLRRHLQKNHRRFSQARIHHTPASTSSFQLERLLSCGDVNPNPGPQTSVKSKCNNCKRTIAKNHRAVRCASCLEAFHIKCGSVTPAFYCQITPSQQSWFCTSCSINPPFQQNEVTDTTLLDFSDPPSTLGRNLTSESDTVLHFPSKGIVFCHHNVCHISNKLDEIQLLLCSSSNRKNGRSNHILGLSETFLDESWTDTELAVDGYSLVRADRTYNSGGGLLVFIPSHISFKRRVDLEFEALILLSRQTLFLILRVITSLFLSLGNSEQVIDRLVIRFYVFDLVKTSVLNHLCMTCHLFLGAHLIYTMM